MSEAPASEYVPPKDLVSRPRFKAKKRPKKHLTTSEKAEAIALWQAGEVTLEDLSTKYKRTPEAFSLLFRRAGVKKGEKRAEAMEAVTKAINSGIVDDAEAIAQRVRDTKDEHYKAARALAGITFNMITAAKRDNIRMSTLINDMKTLKVAAETLAITRKERWAVLGLEDTDKPGDGDELPELVIRELTSDQIKDMHAQQAAQMDQDGGFDMDDSLLGDLNLDDDQGEALETFEEEGVDA